MSSLLSYHELIKFTVSHQADTDWDKTISRGIHLTPTMETQQKLRNGKMLFKPIFDGGVLLFRAIDNNRTPMTALAPGTTLTFIIQSENKGEFMRLTNLDVGADTYDRSKILFFKQVTGSTTADASTITLDPIPVLITKPKTPLFNYEFELSSTAYDVNLRVEDTNLEWLQLSGSLNESGTRRRFKEQLDLRKFAAHKYEITLSYDDTNAPAVTNTSTVYVDDHLASSDLIGLLEITFDPPYYTNKYQCNLTFET